MIKTVIKKDLESRFNYPKLMIGVNTGIIFLMRTRNIGYIIYSDNNKYPVGHSNITNGFEPIDEMVDFNGEITLCNK